MTYTVDTVETEGGYEGRIVTDDYAENPREAFDWHVAVLTQLSRDYVQPDSYPDEDVLRAWDGGRVRYHDTELVERYARAFLGAVATDWWDDPRSSSRVFGYITREACDRHGIADPLAALNAEMREYAAWAQGDVYGYVVTDPAGDEIDSCWSYYGDDELPYMRQCITDAINTDRDRVHAERVAKFPRLVAMGGGAA